MVPLELAADLLQYDSAVSALEMQLTDAKDMDRTRKNSADALGEAFLVKTRYQKNALMYSTNASEKLFTFIVLCLHRTDRCVQHHRLAHHDDDREAPGHAHPDGHGRNTGHGACDLLR